MGCSCAPSRERFDMIAAHNWPASSCLSPPRGGAAAAGLGGFAQHHCLCQCAGRARLVVLWRVGLVSFGRRFTTASALCGSAHRALDRLTDAFGLVLLGGLGASCGRLHRLPAGALPRNLFAMLSLALSIFPVRRAGEIRIAGIDDGFTVANPTFLATRRTPRRLVCRCTGSRSASTPSRHYSSSLISARSPGAGAPFATTKSASNFSAYPSTISSIPRW